MEERILTLHPEGKQGVRISKQKYEQVKEVILTILQEEGGEMTFKAMSELADKTLQDNFDGKPLWYIVSVKLDLEARKIIERVPKTSPHRIKLVE